MVLTDFLKQIADSIRTKDGTTGTIKATDFPQRILAIEGGSSDSFSEYISTGTFTLNADTQDPVIVPHGLGYVPVFVTIFPEDITAIVGTLVYSFVSKDTINTYAITTGHNKVSSTRTGAYTIEVDNANITLITNNTTFWVRGGITYRWFAWKGGAV